MNDPHCPVVLTKLRDELNASVLASRLQACDIPAIIVGGFVAGFKAETPAEIEIRVPRRDLQRAQAALAELDAEARPYHWTEEELQATEDAEPSDER